MLVRVLFGDLLSGNGAEYFHVFSGIGMLTQGVINDAVAVYRCSQLGHLFCVDQSNPLIALPQHWSCPILTYQYIGEQLFLKVHI